MARTANPQDNADLFRAVRGRKGNFGVVTSVVIDRRRDAPLGGRHHPQRPSGTHPVLRHLDLTANAVDAVLRLAGPGVDTSITLVEIRHLGGALAREPRQPNAVGGRDAGFLVYACSIVPPEEAAQAVAAHRALLSALAP
jgi:hypothetical protein